MRKESKKPKQQKFLNYFLFLKQILFEKRKQQTQITLALENNHFQLTK